MPNKFIRASVSGANTAANTDISVYSTPANTTSVLLGFITSNILSEQITYTARIDDSSGVVFYLGKDLPLQTGSSEELIEAKMVMEEGDELFVLSSANNAITSRVSIMEVT